MSFIKYNYHFHQSLDEKNGKNIFLAGGCFWGTEHYFKQIEGVVETEVGFANGHTAIRRTRRYKQ